jgi:hypothetical protein
MGYTFRPYNRLHRVADALLEGPTSIRPPASEDRDGWLTRVLGIRLHLATPVPGRRMAVYRDPQQAIAIYVDGTANRTKGFLRPVIRHASWDRLADVTKLNDSIRPWPHVPVRLGTMQSRQITLAFVTRLHRRLRRHPFVPYFSSRRGIPPLRAGGGGPGHMSVFVHNGAQTIEYAAPTNGPDHGLARLVIAGLRLLQDQMQPFPLRGWSECYPFNPVADPAGTDAHWTWRYTRRAERVNSPGHG